MPTPAPSSRTVCPSSSGLWSHSHLASIAAAGQILHSISEPRRARRLSCTRRSVGGGSAAAHPSSASPATPGSLCPSASLGRKRSRQQPGAVGKNAARWPPTSGKCKGQSSVSDERCGRAAGGCGSASGSSSSGWSSSWCSASPNSRATAKPLAGPPAVAARTPSASCGREARARYLS